MTNSERYRERLESLDDWDTFLMRESGLPGPRANLELVQVAAEMGTARQFKKWISMGRVAAGNSAEVFPALCGVVGLGRLVAGGSRGHLPRLRELASDSRWRVREAVAMGLQRWGDRAMDALLDEMTTWSRGSLLEKRAVAAATCEPRLLREQRHITRVLALLDSITKSIERCEDRKSDDFRVLRQAMGYCWSVAVCAAPAAGKSIMTKWLKCGDHDVRWIMKENLKKDRLSRIDPDWVAWCRQQLEV